MLTPVLQLHYPSPTQSCAICTAHLPLCSRLRRVSMYAFCTSRLVLGEALRQIVGGNSGEREGAWMHVGRFGFLLKFRPRPHGWCWRRAEAMNEERVRAAPVLARLHTLLVAGLIDWETNGTSTKSTGYPGNFIQSNQTSPADYILATASRPGMMVIRKRAKHGACTSIHSFWPCVGVVLSLGAHV